MIESFPLFKKLSYISKLSSQTKNFKIFKRALTILNGMRQRLVNDMPSSVFYAKFQIHLWDDIQQMTTKFIHIVGIAFSIIYLFSKYAVLQYSWFLLCIHFFRQKQTKHAATKFASICHTERHLLKSTEARELILVKS